MSLEDTFGHISSKTIEIDFDKTWQRDGEWGKSDPIKFLARSLKKSRERGKIPTR